MDKASTWLRHNSNATFRATLSFVLSFRSLGFFIVIFKLGHLQGLFVEIVIIDGTYSWSLGKFFLDLTETVRERRRPRLGEACETILNSKTTTRPLCPRNRSRRVRRISRPPLSSSASGDQTLCNRLREEPTTIIDQTANLLSDS